MPSLPSGQDAQTPNSLGESGEAFRKRALEVNRARYQVFLDRAKQRMLTPAEIAEAERLEVVIDTLQAMERPQGS